MNVYESILSRRSTRRFKQVPVEKEKLLKIVEAGRFAPSGGNNQTNHFLVIQKPEVIQDLVKLVEGAFAKMELAEGLYRSIQNSIVNSRRGGYVFCYDAPVLIVVANQKDYPNNMADSAIAIENMMLEANELDLGSCWINQLRWLQNDEAILAYLQTFGLKENERIFGSLAVGYAATENGLPQRNPLERKGNSVTWI